MFSRNLSSIFSYRACVRAVSFTLIAAMMASQTTLVSAAARNVAAESRDNLAFWYRASGLPEKMRSVSAGQLWADAAAQEGQPERDAQVASIRIHPENITMKTGEREFFGAIAYDGKGEPVSGVHFTWRSYYVARNVELSMAQTGEFTPKAQGQYRITVEGAGHKAETIVTVAKDETRPNPNAAPVSVREVSSRDEPAATAAPAAPSLAEDHDWDSGNYWSYDDPDNERGDPPGRPLDEGAGSSNFQFSAPVLALPGRGIDLSLNLAYNSRNWNKAGTEISYDIDRDSPAPGWSLGFGRMIGMGANGMMLVDADGTRHSATVTVTNHGGGYYSYSGRTTDGTFIDFTGGTNNTSAITYATAKFPNGTVIQYGAPGRGAVFPTQITDANGNYISVRYRLDNGAQKGPKIDFVTDTLGRVVQFHYDGNKLTAITTPGLGGGTRTLVRLHYKTLTLSYNFSGLTARVGDPTPRVIDAIYYPGTNTGYWFGDSDSYSSYGMLAKVVEQRGMGFSSSGLNVEGTVTAGTMTRQSVYNYPLTAGGSLTDAPTYTTMTETWDGMDTAAAVTNYLVEKFTGYRKVTITQPDGTKSIQFSYIRPNQYDDGQIYQDETRDASNTLLRKSTVTWERGDYDSPRPVRMEVTDERNQLTAAQFAYGPYNQVKDVWDYGYGGTTLLRKTTATYVTDTAYTNRHIFNLVRRVDVFDSTGTTRVSRTQYDYDENTGTQLTNTPNVVQHDVYHNPYMPPQCNWEPDTSDPDFYGCVPGSEPRCDGIVDQIQVCGPGYDPVTDKRGNPTSVRRYTDALNLTGEITETRTYDITGNLRTVSSSCCEQTSFDYVQATQYAYPTGQARGASDPNSTARVTTTTTYDFNTGLARFATDANGRQAETQYFADTWRAQKAILSTGGYINYAYDDAAMTVTETAYLANNTMASQNVKRLNGQGQVKREEALGQGGVWDFVETKFDKMVRVWKQTRPFRSTETAQWSEVVYDALGRVRQTIAPDGSQTNTYYNETTRPSGASTAAGQTVRVADAWGRERWSRADADGRLVEVVEPNPAGSGSVTASGHLLTTYSYDALGHLTQVNQGTQQRRFRYDSLSRLTHQKLAEEKATLNDSGQYVGAGTWSEFFTYDTRSNLIAQTDARGIKTVYTYNNDPLNRLQAVSYDTLGFGDTLYPIQPAATVRYEYMAAGDVTQLYKVKAEQVSVEQFGYDGEGRLSSMTLTLTSRPNHPMAVDYVYDTLNRVADVRYPAQHGFGAGLRKLAHHDFDEASRVKGVKFDGLDYASQLAYNAASQTTTLKVGAAGANQITESYTYDNQTGLLTNQKVQRGVTSLLDLSYLYVREGTASNRTGQVTKVLNNLDHNKDRHYEYDALGRLKRAKGGVTFSAPLWTQDYGYDRYGNRTSVVATGTAAGGAVMPRDGLASVGYEAASNRVNNLGWEYDASGNLMRGQRADGVWLKYQYDAAGRLVKVKNDACQTVVVNTYGASNHRLIEQRGDESSNDRTYYVWGGEAVLAEYQESAALPSTPTWAKSYVYLEDSLLATSEPNGAVEKVQYHHADRLGTRLITNNLDTTVSEQVSLPFGTALDAESSITTTKRRFTSYDRNAVTGLDYAVNRHYDPSQGRFTQVDPIGMAAADLWDPQTLNLYSYCGNDPINYVDPSGLFFGKLFKAIGSFFKKAISFLGRALKVLKIAVTIAVAVLGLATIVGASWALPVLLWLGKTGILGIAGVPGVSFGTPSTFPGGGFSGINRFVQDAPIKLSVDCALDPSVGGPGCPPVPWYKRALRSVENWATGFAHAVTTIPFTNFSIARRLDDRRGLNYDENSTAYSVGSWTGTGAQAVVPVGAGVKAVQAAGYGGKFALHTAHHTFGRLGKLSHLQLNIWRKGIRGSGRVFRIPLPLRRLPRKDRNIFRF